MNTFIGTLSLLLMAPLAGPLEDVPPQTPPNEGAPNAGPANPKLVKTVPEPHEMGVVRMTLDGLVVIRTGHTHLTVTSAGGAPAYAQHYSERDDAYDFADLDIRTVEGRAVDAKRLRKRLTKPAVAVLVGMETFDARDYAHFKNDTLVIRFRKAPAPAAGPCCLAPPPISYAVPSVGYAPPPQYLRMPEPAEAIDRVAGEPFGVAIAGPTTVRQGDKVTLRVRVTNNSSAVLENVKLVVVLSGGLSDSDGNNTLNQTLAQPLHPGQTFADTLTVVAKEAGHATVRLVAATESTSKSGGCEVEVLPKGEPAGASAPMPPKIPASETSGDLSK